MHIARQTQQELVVVDGTRWLALIFLAVTLLLVVSSVTRHEGKLLFVAGFFLLFAAAFARRTTVVLDGMQRVARWSRRTLLGKESGSIPFDDITDIVLDASPGANGALAYRLQMVTADGKTPMASVFNSGLDHYENLRGQILDFIKPGAYAHELQVGTLSNGVPADLESSLRSLLKQGRRIDAIELLRSREQIGLTDAVARVNALDDQQRTPS
jgi:hypothetical protein